jgi:hypothetical protein
MVLGCCSSAVAGRLRLDLRGRGQQRRHGDRAAHGRGDDLNAMRTSQSRTIVTLGEIALADDRLDLPPSSARARSA